MIGCTMADPLLRPTTQRDAPTTRFYTPDGKSAGQRGDIRQHDQISRARWSACRQCNSHRALKQEPHK
jgi:hypothetical protein